LQALSELQVRGFAPPAIARHERAGPIGMLEYWNNGFWDNAILG